MQKDKKTSFPKEQIENTDFYKPVLNKIMTTQEQCKKYNFVAPLTNTLKTPKIRKSQNIH